MSLELLPQVFLFGVTEVGEGFYLHETLSRLYDHLHGLLTGRRVLQADETTVEVAKDGAFSFDLDGCGVAGLLFAPDDAKWAARLAAFAKPYPEPDAFDKAWLDGVAEQKRLREEPPAWKKVWMSVSVPNLSTMMTTS